MIVVHHLENSRSQRVLWLLEELGVPYEVRRYQRDAKTMLAPPELVAIHPLGKSPVIDDGGLVVAETGAIVEYLLDRYAAGRLQPAPDEMLAYRYWMHFAEGSAMPPLVMQLVFQRLPANAPWPVRPVARAIATAVDRGYLRPTITKQLAFIETELSSRPWFAGAAMTAADVMMSFPLEAARARGMLERDQAARHWLDTIHARPAYQAALAAGGPYDYA